MKTKIKSLIIICIIGLVGVLKVNASLSYKTSCIAQTQGDEKNAKTGLINANESLTALNEKTASFTGELYSENLNSAEFLLNENAEIDYLKEAQLATKLVVDKEEDKAIQVLIDKGLLIPVDETVSLAYESESENLNTVENLLNETTETKIDFQKEAQLMTRLVVDKAEAKTVQMLIDEGKLPENN